MIRPPAVAGQFYSASAAALEAEVAGYLDASAAAVPMTAVICPHAGLMYSGHVAGAVLSRATLPDTVILIGPNHTGIGPAVSVYPEGAWQIPGGAVPVNRDLARAILARYPRAEADISAHQWEHCLEVQLPFLRRRRRDVRIVPIVLGTRDPAVCRTLGHCLAALIQELRGTNRTSDRQPLLLASTDMNHYESDQVTRDKDRHAIAAIERLDPDGLDTAVTNHDISMCGVAPTLAVLHAGRALGSTGATLVSYATSADRGGDRARVVGYAGFTVTHENV
jgi:AmmeMemoRadiSam system protein B